MRDTNFIGVGGLLYHQNKYLLVKHAYGEYNEQWIIPGGYVKNGEHPSDGAEREVFEETSIRAKALDLIALRTRQRSDQCLDCYLVFAMEYLSGEAVSDGVENSDAAFFTYEEIMNLDNVIPLSKIIIERHHKGLLNPLKAINNIDPYIEKNGFLKLYF